MPLVAQTRPWCPQVASHMCWVPEHTLCSGLMVCGSSRGRAVRPHRVGDLRGAGPLGVALVVRGQLRWGDGCAGQALTRPGAAGPHPANTAPHTTLMHTRGL